MTIADLDLRHTRLLWFGMELRHLRHFVAVAEAGNMTRAAERVFISQPALTRSIKSLEDLLGARLIDRLPRGVVLTAPGEALYRYGKLVLNECARARAEVKALESGALGQISVGVAALFSDHIVDEVVARVCSGDRPASLRVRQGFYEEMVEELRDGRLDLIFSNIPEGAAPSDLTVELLYDVRTAVFTNSASPLAGKRRVEKAELLQERWAVVDQPHMRDFLDLFFAADGLGPPSSVVLTNSLNLIRALVSRERFVTILPEHLMKAAQRSGSVKPVRLEGPPVVRRAGLIQRKDVIPHPVATRFMHELRAACGAAGSGA